MITQVFEYNQHFVAMMNIINSARFNPPKEGHKHHIIPRCWFKMNNLPVDNSKDNLALLTYEDHVKVHKLAYLCALNNKFKVKMACAYHRLTQGEIVSNGAFAGERNPNYGKHHKHTDSTKKLMSQNVRNYFRIHPECKVHSKAHKDKIKAYLARRTAAWHSYNGSLSYQQFIKEYKDLEYGK